MKDKMKKIARTQFSHRAKRAPVWLLASLIALVSAGISQAAVRQELSGLPFYARGADTPAEAYTDGVTAVIAFYRPPAFIPPTFNLMAFYDFAMDPDCSSSVAGFAIFSPDTADLGPIQLNLKNTGPMAVWFVSLVELQDAQSDGIMTIDELASLPSLVKGTATFYTETLHAYGAAQRTLVTIVASGSLEDGTSFAYQIVGNQGGQEYPSIRRIEIMFK
jgi:hypothetical protein